MYIIPSVNWKLIPFFFPFLNYLLLFSFIVFTQRKLSRLFVYIFQNTVKRHWNTNHSLLSVVWEDQVFIFEGKLAGSDCMVVELWLPVPLFLSPPCRHFSLPKCTTLVSERISPSEKMCVGRWGRLEIASDTCQSEMTPLPVLPPQALTRKLSVKVQINYHLRTPFCECYKMRLLEAFVFALNGSWGCDKIRSFLAEYIPELTSLFTGLTSVVFSTTFLSFPGVLIIRSPNLCTKS